MMNEHYLQECRKKYEALYRKQQGFSTVRDYYRIDLANSYIKRNIPLPMDDKDVFNDWLSLYQESTMIHGNDSIFERRKEFLALVTKLQTNKE